MKRMRTGRHHVLREMEKEPHTSNVKKLEAEAVSEMRPCRLGEGQSLGPPD